MDGLHYASESGERSEEIPIEGVLRLIADGAIDDATLVWADGMDDWVPLSECRSNFPGLMGELNGGGIELYIGLHYEGADGPSDEISTAQAAGLIANGTITDATLVWIDGMDAWTALAECRHLFAGLGAEGAGQGEDRGGLLPSLYYELAADQMSEETSVAFAAMLAEEGDITASTNVWSEGWEGWAPLGECQQLFAVLCDVQLQPGEAAADEHAEHEDEDEGEAPGLSEGIPGMVQAFHYEIDGEQSDEIAASAIAGLLADGTLTEATPVWAEGMEGWTALIECTEVIEGLAAALGGEGEGEEDTATLLLMYEQDSDTPEVGMEAAASLVSSGMLTATTLVWTEGFDNWTPLGECADTFPGVTEALAPKKVKAKGRAEQSSSSESKSKSDGATAGGVAAVPNAFYYVTASGTHSPKVPVSRVPSLFKAETLSLDSMVWTEGMDQWYKLSECKSKLAGLERVLQQLRTPADADDSNGAGAAKQPKMRDMGLQEKKQIYAELVKKIVNGTATASDTIEAERLGSELEELEDDTMGVIDDSVQSGALVLSKMAIFESLTNDQCLMIAKSMERCEYESGDVIFDQGDHGDYFYILEGGGVKVVTHRATKQEKVLKEIDHGGYFGELALLSRNPRAASCVATVQGAKLLRVSRVGFDRALGPMVKIIRNGMVRAGAQVRPEPINLVGACLYGSTEKVEMFLASERPIGGAAAMLDQKKRVTLLHVAASLGHVDVVRYLLKNGAQIDGATKAGATALHMAAREGRTQVVQLLCASNAMVSAKTTVGGATPIFLAAQGGHVHAMTLLIKHRADSTGGCGKTNSTPLHVASERGHFDAVTFLLSGNRAAVNQADSDGATALHYAAAFGHASIVWRLLERGAQANSAMPNGATAFFLAAQNGHGPVLQMLLTLPGVDLGVKATTASGDEVTALDVAKERGHKAVADVLEELMSSLASLPAGKRAGQMDSMRKDATFSGDAKPRLKSIRDQPLRKGPSRSTADNAHVGQLKKGMIVEVQEQKKDERGVLRMSVNVTPKLKGWVRNSDQQGNLFEPAS